jgi:DDE superfamily endonuclease
MAGWGWPPRVKHLESMAKDILKSKGKPTELGQHWYKNFLNRHPELKARFARGLDQKRKDAEDPKTIQEWFDLYTATVAKYGVSADDRYNMDEKGIALGVGDKTKALVPQSQAQAFIAEPGNREWVSLIECISGSGFQLPPYIIFEGKQVQRAWITSRLNRETVIRVSDSGWTNSDIALNWLSHFDSYTKPRLQGIYRLLILDGHESHVSLQFVEYCEAHKIVPLCLPPHSTHILQPLDVSIFGPLARAYKKRLYDTALYGALAITKQEFLEIYQAARSEAISSTNMASTWRATGLIPYDPSIVLSKIQSETPPFASLTNKDGVRIDIPVSPSVGERINEAVDFGFTKCYTCAF